MDNKTHTDKQIARLDKFALLFIIDDLRKQSQEEADSAKRDALLKEASRYSAQLKRRGFSRIYGR